MKKSCCVTCKYRHGYYKRKLTNKEAWCLHFGKLVKNKKNCIHIENKYN